MGFCLFLCIFRPNGLKPIGPSKFVNTSSFLFFFAQAGRQASKQGIKKEKGNFTKSKPDFGTLSASEIILLTTKQNNIRVAGLTLLFLVLETQ